MAAEDGAAKAISQGYDAVMDAAAPARLHLDEVIVRKPSLGKRGFFVLIGLLVTLNLGLGVAFVLMGAPPVPVFLGLDVLAVWLAFRFSYRQSRRLERVQVTADEVRVVREDGGKAETVWTSPTAFTRVALVAHERYAPEVVLSLSGRRLAVGQALGPRQRSELARAIEAAIKSARNERYEG
jgi:uncharacterized membrane protein